MHNARPSRTMRPGLDAVALAAALLLTASPARAELLLNPNGWKFPNIVTSAKEVIRVSDRTPLIAGKETILKGYRKMDGTYFMTYEIEGRVFGVEVDSDGKPPFDYSIMDTDGDGKFETKLVPSKGSKDRAYVPQWVIDHYYARHPDQKNPSGPVRAAAPNIKASEPPPPAGAPPAPPKPAAPPPPEVAEQPNP